MKNSTAKGWSARRSLSEAKNPSLPSSPPADFGFDLGTFRSVMVSSDYTPVRLPSVHFASFHCETWPLCHALRSQSSLQSVGPSVHHALLGLQSATPPEQSRPQERLNIRNNLSVIEKSEHHGRYYVPECSFKDPSSLSSHDFSRNFCCNREFE